VSAGTVESASLSPTDPRDYRRENLLGSMMVVVGALFAVVLIVVAIGNASSIRWTWVIEAMIVPAMLVLTGLLVIGRAKLALWLMYVLTADFVYSLIREFVHALKTRHFDDIYSVLFDTCVLSVWLCIATYFYNRREMFTGFWGSLEAGKNQRAHGRSTVA
jgi:uncharacterized integral membrane protein